VLGEVGEILHVQRCERQLADQAACCDSRVVRWPGSTPELGIGLKFSPHPGHGFAIGKHDESGQEGLHASLALWPPVTHQCHLVSSPTVTKVMARVLPARWRARVVEVRQRRTERQRRCRGRQCSRDVGVPGGVEVSKEVLVLLLGFPQVGLGQIVDGDNRLDALPLRKLVGRDLLGGPAARVLGRRRHGIASSVTPSISPRRLCRRTPRRGDLRCLNPH
jgi:hypothetical protein